MRGQSTPNCLADFPGIVHGLCFMVSVLSSKTYSLISGGEGAREHLDGKSFIRFFGVHKENREAATSELSVALGRADTQTPTR